MRLRMRLWYLWHIYEIKHVDLYTYLQPYSQELSNLTLCIMETLNLSYVYADRDGYDECMRTGSLKTSLSVRLYIYMYHISTTLFIIIF